MTTEQDFIRMKRKYSKRRERRRLEGLWWALVLIWAGLVFGADSVGLIPPIGHATAWSWIFLGAGVAGILGAFYRSSTPRVLKPTTWDWVWSGFCLIVGLGGFVTLNVFWPLILVLVGGIALVHGLRLRD